MTRPLQLPAVQAVMEFVKGSDRLLELDFTGSAASPDAATMADTSLFSDWVEQKILEAGCRYGIGGYRENRLIYASRNLFDGEGEARSLHLGTDIWGPAGTAVFAPLDGRVHSFGYNEGNGNYGGTIILEHSTGGEHFYTLYGHLSKGSLEGVVTGKMFRAGEQVATLGDAAENGNWPPHLHFQVMLAMDGWEGDYPGVCKPSEQEKWLQNSPDPMGILGGAFV